MRRNSITVVLALATLLFVSTSPAQQVGTITVPNLIRYGGTLTDASGAPMTAATGVTIAIYKEQDGGAPMWTETQSVTPDAKGQYNVILGSTTATGLPSDLFSQDEQRWLGVQVQGQPEQARVLLVSVPYAMKAADADKLSGRSASEFVTSDTLQSVVQQQLQQQVATASSAKIPAGGQTSTTAKRPLVPTDGATNFTDNTPNQVVLVTQNGTGQGLTVTAKLGYAILATSNAYTINAVSNDTTGYSGAIRGYASAPSGFGVFGGATSTTGVNYGVWGRSVSSSGIGLRGMATATTGSTVGVSGSVASPAGIAGVFSNMAGGKILSGQSNGVEKFSVDGNGAVAITGSLTTGSALTVPNGGSGATSFAAYAPVVGGTSTTGALQSTAVGIARQVFVSGGSGAVPAYIDFPDTKVIPAANCIAGTAGGGWSNAASNFTAACRAGSNNLGGALQATPATGAVAQFMLELPADWDTATQPYISIYYGSGANSSGTVIWTVSSACSQMNGSTTDDPAFVAEPAFAPQTMAAASRTWAKNGQFTRMTGSNNCVAGSSVIIKVAVSGTAASAINAYQAVVTIPRLLTVQAN